MSQISLILELERYMYRIIENAYAMFEGTCQDHQIQLLALGRAPQGPHHVPESISLMLLELTLSWGCDHFPGEPFPVPNQYLSEKLSPSI